MDNKQQVCSPYIREKVIETFFTRSKDINHKIVAKAILLDMEPKVV